MGEFTTEMEEKLLEFVSLGNELVVTAILKDMSVLVGFFLGQVP